MYGFEKGTLTQNQRMGILNLLPKKDKDIRHLAYWRPVSLLNTDYTILTKAFAISLQNVVPSKINHDQVGYIKNRYIGENIRIIFDLLKYSDLNDIESLLSTSRFWESVWLYRMAFFFKCLDYFNLGHNFCKYYTMKQLRE